VELGKTLFLDRRLSVDRTISCASCHRPELAFTDGKTTAEGVAGRRGTRNTPSLLDIGNRSMLTWDGRNDRLEFQVLVPFTHAREFGMASYADVLAVLRRDARYRHDFRTVFGTSDIEIEHVGSSLAAYVRTLESESSPFDRFVSGDTGSISESARRGYQLFRGSAGCGDCHRVSGPGSTFTDEQFHRAGIGVGAIIDRLPEITQRVMATPRDEMEALIASTPEVAALGRFIVTRDPRDIAAYRTPSLRNVAVTAPYMHDGSVATLRDAVSREVYYRTQERQRATNVTLIDQDDLVAFLETLTSDRFRRLLSEPTAAR
jgi:cytochrome c peroxidase